MHTPKRRWLAFLAAPLIILAGLASLVSAAPSARIVSLDGITTEIIAALGDADELVGRDDSSYKPPFVTRLPSVGYQFELHAEGVIALKPTLVIGREDAKPATALDAIRAAGVPLLLVSAAPSLDGARSKIRSIAHALNRVPQGEAMIASLDRDAATVSRAVASRPIGTRPRALFLFSAGLQHTLICGTGSNAISMLELAGAINALPQIQDCQSATSEALVASRPDVIVLFTMSLKALGGMDGLLKFPGVAATPAGRERHILAYDALALDAFGSETGTMLLTLNHDLFALRR